MEERTRTGRMDFIKIRNFCSTKDTAKRLRRQATNWKKIRLQKTFLIKD
jgi:hypothetical protein